MARTIRPDFAAWALARRQHWVVALWQLRELGFTRYAIDHRVRTGRLWRVYPGVFAVGRQELSPKGAWLAAVLACGPGATLSHLSAAALWEIWDRPAPARPQVSVASRNGRTGPGGIDLHRSRTLTENDLTERGAIGVTTLERTLIDVARVLDAKSLKSVLRQSERVHRLELGHLRDSLDALPRHSAGPARLRRALDEYIPGTSGTESDRETAFLELCAGRGLPQPETQVRLGPYRLDFVWPELGLVVELDDRQSHDGHVAFREDRVRDRRVKAAGLDTYRFTVTEVGRGPDSVADELAQEVARRTRGESRGPWRA